MAGIQAGRLSIEIVAEIARLQQDLDKAKRAVSAASGDIAKSAKAANDNLASLGKGVNGIGATSKQAAFGMRNLAFQAQDLGVQFAMAANSSEPLKGILMALVMQGPQIKDALNQTGKSAKELATDFAKAHPVLLGVAAAAGVAATALGLFTATMNETKKKEIDAFKDSLGLTAKELKELGPVAISAGDVIKGLGMTIEEYLGVKSEKIVKNLKTMMFDAFKAIGAYSMVATSAIYAGFSGTFDAVKIMWAKLPSVIGDAAYSAANLVISGLNYLLQKGTAYINAWSGLINAVLGKIPGFEGTQIGTLTAPQISEIANPFKGAATSVAGEVAGAYSKRFGEAMAGQQGFFAKAGENSFKAMKERVTKEAREKGMLDDEDAKKAGGRAGKAAGDEFAKKLAEAIEAAKGRFSDAIIDAISGTGEGFQNVGDDLNKLFADLGKAAGDWATKEVERLNAELSQTLSILESLGGVAGTFGKVLSGLQSGNFAGLGPIGGLINIALQGPKDYEKQAQVIADRISDVFGVSGPFAKTLAGVLQGAATGALAGSIVGNSKGNQIGGLVGGAIGQGIGSSISALGSFGGPIGAIVGGILGSVVGGLFKKTPTGSAILGQGGIVGTSGNGGRDASGLGTSVVSALDRIASALGATVGNYSVSIGMRGDNYKVDPTGAGRTKEAGVLDFGKDAQAAVTAAIRDAISDGALQGLSEGVKRALTTGDLETQLQKVAAYMAVPDALAQAKDPQGYASQQLEKEFANLKSIFDEMGASAAEYAQLEELLGIKRAELAKNDEAAAKALEVAQTRRQMEIQLMDLSGDSIGALAAARALEKEQIDPTLHALYDEIAAKQDLIKASQDAAEEQARLNEATERARATALTTRNYEIALMEAQGNAQGALNAKRQLEVDAASEADRSIIRMIHAAQDASTASKDAADAQDRLAEAQRNAAQAAREAQDALNGTIGDLFDIQAQIAALSDNPAVREQFKQFDRSRQLADADPLLKPWLEKLFEAQDVAAQRAADEERVNKWLKERRSLQQQLMELEGRTDEALASTRYELLAALDPANRALQERVWLLQDEKAAAEEARRIAEENRRLEEQAQREREQRITEARNALASAYNRESSALKDTINRFGAFSKELREFRNTLSGSGGLVDQYRRAQALFVDTSSAARMGDVDALGKLSSVAKEFLVASMNRASSALEYNRDVARVKRALDDAIGASDTAVNYAQDQLTALDKLVEGQDLGNEAALSAVEALNRLLALQGGEAVPVPAAAPVVAPVGSTASTTSTVAPSSSQSEIGALRAELNARLDAIASNTGRLARNSDRMEDRINANEPIPVEVVTP